MTIANENRRNQYTASGSTTDFTFEFAVTDESHVKVIETDLSGNKNIPVLNSDFTVEGVGDPGGGTVKYIIAPVVNTIITLKLDIPATQLVDYILNDAFPSDSHESALDKMTNLVKILLDLLDRTIHFDEDEVLTDPFTTLLPTATPDSFIGFDANERLALFTLLPGNIVTNLIDTGEVKSINTQTGTSYTLQLTDVGAVVEMTNASSNTITVPPNSSVAFPIKTRLDITQYGAGPSSMVAGGGVTLRGGLNVRDQYFGLSLYKRATDEWVIFGGD